MTTSTTSPLRRRRGGDGTGGTGEAADGVEGWSAEVAVQRQVAGSVRRSDGGTMDRALARESGRAGSKVEAVKA